MYEKLEERQEHEAREGPEDQDGLEDENSHTETSSLLESIDSLDADSPTRHARTCETNETHETYGTFNPHSSKKSYTRTGKPDKHPNEKNETSPKPSLKKIKEKNVKNVKTEKNETTRTSCAATSKPKPTVKPTVQTDAKTETRTNETNETNETNKTNDKSEKTTPHCRENNLPTNSLFTYDLSHDDLLHKKLLHESVTSNDLLPSAHSNTGSDNQNNATNCLPSGTMDLVGYMETAERLNQLNNINQLNRSNHQLHQTAYQDPQHNTHLPLHQNANQIQNQIQQNREPNQRPNQRNHLHPNDGGRDIYRHPSLAKTEPNLNSVSYSAKPIDLLTTSNSANPINTTNPVNPVEPIDPTTKHTDDPTSSIGLTKLKDKLLSPHKVSVSVDTNRRKSTANEMNYVLHNDLLPQPDFEYRPIKPSKMRILYAIAGTIVACVAILVTYQIIRVQIDKRAAARRAQTEKDIANAEDPLTRRDQFITNQAEQTYSTIDRLNSAVARHEEKMAQSKDMINEILKNFNVEQVRELKDKIEKISYDKDMDVEDIQQMIDEMKKRTPRALDKLETLKAELAALTEKRQELSLTNFINQQPVYGADLQKPYWETTAKQCEQTPTNDITSDITHPTSKQEPRAPPKTVLASPANTPVSQVSPYRPLTLPLIKKNSTQRLLSRIAWSVYGAHRRGDRTVEKTDQRRPNRISRAWHADPPVRGRDGRSANLDCEH